MKTITILSYILGIFGTFLLAPHIIPFRLMKFAENTIQQAEKKLHASTGFLFNKINTLFKNKGIEPVGWVRFFEPINSFKESKMKL